MTDEIRTSKPPAPPEPPQPKKRADVFKEGPARSTKRSAPRRQIPMKERTFRFPHNVSQAINAVCERYDIPPSRFVGRAVLELLLKYDNDIVEQFAIGDKRRNTVWDDMRQHGGAFEPELASRAFRRAEQVDNPPPRPPPQDLADLVGAVLPLAVPPAPTRDE